MSNESKTRPVCAYCGGTDVAVDASATWNMETGEWELLCTYDNADCHDCGGETEICWEPVA